MTRVAFLLQQHPTFDSTLSSRRSPGPQMASKAPLRRVPLAWPLFGNYIRQSSITKTCLTGLGTRPIGTSLGCLVRRLAMTIRSHLSNILFMVTHLAVNGELRRILAWSDVIVSQTKAYQGSVQCKHERNLRLW